MRIAKTVYYLPPDLLVKAQEVAQREHRTISELFAKRSGADMATDPEWDALLRRTRTTGRALGIESEADVERLSDEFRQERQRSSAR